jgi:hypothetical protein
MYLSMYTYMCVLGQVCMRACMYVRMFALKRGYEGPQAECRNSSILSLTPALDAVGSRRHAEAASFP